MKSGGLLGVLGAIGAGLFFFLPKGKKEESVFEFSVPGVFEGEVTSPQEAVTVAVASGDALIMEQTAEVLRENGYNEQAKALEDYAQAISNAIYASIPERD